MTESLPIEKLPSRAMKLVRLAKKAQKKAYAPYSKYQVGCVLVDNEGKLYSGCNVENVSYSAVLCAERVALGKMVSKGSRKLKKIILITPSEEPIFPCGVCLQVLQEFGAEAEVLSVNRRQTLFRESTIKELYPQAFSQRNWK
jgi:cytidine deaminase